MVSSVLTSLQTLTIQASTKAAQNLEKIDLTYNGIQGICTKKAFETPKSFSRYNRQNLFFALDAISLTATASLAAKTISKHKIITQILSNTPLATTCSLLALGTIFLTVYTLNRFYQPRIPIEIENITFASPLSQKIKQALYVTRIILNIALAILFPANPLFIISALIEIYSLVCISQRTWLKFFKETEYQPDVHLIETKKIKRLIQQGRYQISSEDDTFFNCTYKVSDKIRITHFFLLHKVPQPSIQKKSSESENSETSNQDDSEKCIICMETSPTYYFCQNNHKLHLPCIGSLINSQLSELQEKITYICHEIRETQHHYKGVPIGKTYRAVYYPVLSETARPRCPLCRSLPNEEIAIKFHDLVYKWSESYITWN